MANEQSSVPPSGPFPPSVKNNHHKALVDTSIDYREKFKGTTLENIQDKFNVDTQRSEFLNLMNQHQIKATGAPWLFFSGLDYMRMRDLRNHIAEALGLEDRWQLKMMGDLCNAQPPQTSNQFRLASDSNYESVYWAVGSIAYAQIAEGQIILLVPRNEKNEVAPVNNAYKTTFQTPEGPVERSKPSFLWTFQIAELTRNPNVTDIIRISVDEEGAFGPMERIWLKGDEPWGVSASPWHPAVLPDENFYPEEIPWPE